MTLDPAVKPRLVLERVKDYSFRSSTGCSSELRGVTTNPMNLIQLVLA